MPPPTTPLYRVTLKTVAHFPRFQAIADINEVLHKLLPDESY
jgi:hypothetical protein